MFIYATIYKTKCKAESSISTIASGNVIKKSLTT